MHVADADLELGGEAVGVLNGGPASTPTPQLGAPPSVSAQSSPDSGVKLAGKDAPLLHEGASEHAVHWPQSTGQVSQFSSPLHTPSPQTWGPSYVASASSQKHALHPVDVHVCVPVAPAGQVSHARELPAVQALASVSASLSPASMTGAADVLVDPPHAAASAKPARATVAKAIAASLMLLPGAPERILAATAHVHQAPASV